MLAVLLSVFMAGTTTAIYATVVWWFDRFEREPWWLLSLAFAWGAVPAVIISLIAEVGFNIPLSALAGQQTDLLSTTLVAPVIEELAKGAALAGIYVLFSSEFDDLMDGILYGTLIGFGFAMTENVFYFIGAFYEQGWGAWAFTVFLRAIIFGFNHAFFTGITGAGFGFARMTRETGKRIAMPILALAGAISFHIAHNALVSSGGAACLLSLFSDGTGVLAIFILLLIAAWQEKKWIREELATEVMAGFLTAEEASSVGSYTKRLVARWVALHDDGWQAMRQTGRRYQQLTELAFKKRQRRRRGDDGCTMEEIEQRRTALFGNK